MPLKFQDEDADFSIGCCQYFPDSSGKKILIFVDLPGWGSISAQVDTGGLYLILDPEVARAIGLEASRGLEIQKINIAGQIYSGNLHRVEITIPAEIGIGVSIQATTFVPDLPPNEDWALPNFMGWHGCLERLRFGVDPLTDTFYFGPIEDG